MKKTRTIWTKEDTETLFEMYPTHPSWEIAEKIGKTKAAVMMRAVKHGLKKPDGYKMRRSPEDTKKKIERQTGKKRGPFTYEHRKRISDAQPNKGCNKTTTENYKARRSVEYRMWRESVYRRDNYTCQHCGQRGGRLNADHVKPFAVFKDLRYDINNGRTLCIDCHKKTPTWGKRYDLLKASYGTTF